MVMQRNMGMRDSAINVAELAHLVSGCATKLAFNNNNGINYFSICI